MTNNDEFWFLDIIAENQVLGVWRWFMFFLCHGDLLLPVDDSAGHFDETRIKTLEICGYVRIFQQ